MLVKAQIENECLFYLNAQLQIQNTCQSFKQLTGIDSNQLKIIDLIEGNDSRIKFNTLLKQGKFDIECKIATKSSELKNFRLVLIKLPSSEVTYVVYLKDLTPEILKHISLLKKTLSIELLAKSRKIRDGNLNEAIFEILQTASRATETQRVNAWLFDKEMTQINCIGNFDSVKNSFVEQGALPRIALPNYFKLFETEKIIVTNDCLNSHVTEELRDIYLEPHNIQSLMDIPIRIEGEMIGVLCFENVGKTREWNLLEQKFGLVTAQLISLALETNHKRIAYEQVQQISKEQQVLLKEIHHRVKNNLSIVASLLSLQSSKSTDEFHAQLFTECRNRVNSIAAVHEMIYKSKSFSKINLKEYIEQIGQFLHQSYKNTSFNVKIENALSDFLVDVSIAVPIALIVNEVYTNSYKHAFKHGQSIDPHIKTILINNKSSVVITIKDNGIGMTEEDTNLKDHASIGTEIIDGLCKQIDANYEYLNDKGTQFKLTLKF
jgi:two-component sensor histidine kinase